MVTQSFTFSFVCNANIGIVCFIVLARALSVCTTDLWDRWTVIPASSGSFIVGEMRIKNEDVQFKENV